MISIYEDLLEDQIIRYIDYVSIADLIKYKKISKKLIIRFSNRFDENNWKQIFVNYKFNKKELLQLIDIKWPTEDLRQTYLNLLKN